MDRFCGILSVFDRYRTLHDMEGKARCRQGRFTGRPLQMAGHGHDLYRLVHERLGVLCRPGRVLPLRTGILFSEMCIYSMFPIICYFTMTKVWLVNQAEALHHPGGFLLLPLQVQGADRYHRHCLHYLRRAVYLGGTGSRRTCS
mgnify:CR=1 FL=1